jgi:hypothetical protein
MEKPKAREGKFEFYHPLPCTIKNPDFLHFLFTARLYGMERLKDGLDLTISHLSRIFYVDKSSTVETHFQVLHKADFDDSQSSPYRKVIVVLEAKNAIAPNESVFALLQFNLDDPNIGNKIIFSPEIMSLDGKIDVSFAKGLYEVMVFFAARYAALEISELGEIFGFSEDCLQNIIVHNLVRLRIVKREGNYLTRIIEPDKMIKLFDLRLPPKKTEKNWLPGKEREEEIVPHLRKIANHLLEAIKGHEKENKTLRAIMVFTSYIADTTDCLDAARIQSALISLRDLINYFLSISQKSGAVCEALVSSKFEVGEILTKIGRLIQQSQRLSST